MNSEDYDFNTKIRGTYLVDNDEKLQTRIQRGENKKFIISYLYANPCVVANRCRKDLLRWRGYALSDASRGQYSSYFYDHYHHKWYHKKFWHSTVDEFGNRRLNLTVEGMANVDLDLAERIKTWQSESSEERTRILISDHETIDRLAGLPYRNIVSKKS